MLLSELLVVFFSVAILLIAGTMLIPVLVSLYSVVVSDTVKAGYKSMRCWLYSGGVAYFLGIIWLAYRVFRSEGEFTVRLLNAVPNGIASLILTVIFLSIGLLLASVPCRYLSAGKLRFRVVWAFLFVGVPFKYFLLPHLLFVS